MKTKNILVLVALIFSSILNVNKLFAQEPTSTDNVTLNIVLHEIQSIVVNKDKDHKTVNLEYKTMQDYQDGVSEERKKHLTVFSTGGFEVKVSSGEFTPSEAGRSISASDVTVQATNAAKGTVYDAVPLGSAQTLIASEVGGRDLEYNVTYNNKAAKGDKYINLYEKDGTNTFTTTVTYTIAAM